MNLARHSRNQRGGRSRGRRSKIAVMKTKTIPHHGRGMESFLARHGAEVTGVIRGFDRVRLRASLRYLYEPSFMMRYLSVANVLLKDFAGYVSGWTERVRAATHALAEQHGRPVRYLRSSAERKELLARELARRDRIDEGLIGVWSCVEPCLTYFVRRDAEAKKLVLRLEPGKCLHHYFYFQHAELGLLHLRLQTWFPFQVWVCLNGRLWLARQLDRAGIDYVQRENCFTHLADVARAQALAQAQVRTHWPTRLQPLLEQCHPLAAELCRPLALSYYWSVDESEYATDVMFKTPAALASLYPALTHHAIRHFGCRDVLRFLGHRVPVHGPAHGNYQGEVLSELKHRPEGLRLKHQVNGNTLKLYDKQGQVLRVETTLNRPHDFRVYRTSERQADGPKRWLVLRKSVADVPRRAQVCAAANDRYLAALAGAPAGTAAGALVRPLCRPITKRGRRYRALNPWAEPDAKLLDTISRGEWALNGFRNRDVRRALFSTPADAAQQRRQAARVTRALALLRAHGLIQKVTGTHRYLVTAHGRQRLTALLAATQADVQQLIQLAA
jgi:hypothetical protein